MAETKGSGSIIQLEKDKPKSRCRKWQLRVCIGKDPRTGKYKARTRRRQAKAEEDSKNDRLCQYYERVFYNSLYEGSDFGDLVAFGSPMEERTAFEKFLRDQAAAKRKPGIDDHCAGLEEELRGGYGDSEGNVHYWTEEEIQNWLYEERAQMDEEFGKKDEEVIRKVMEAYDRLHRKELRNWAVHSGEATPDTVIKYATVRLDE